jgi:putative RecB family exonuclease
MRAYSHSKLATYENCPQQYKLKYIDCIELPEAAEGIEAFLGSRVHETLEKLHKELILTKLNSLEELLAYYGDQWTRKWHENVIVVKKQYGKDHYRDAGREAIRKYYQRHYPFDQSRTLATELPLTFSIDDYALSGVIDRLSHDGKGGYEIHDYKTSATLPSQERLDNDRQLALYQIGIQEEFRDVRDIRLIWHYLLFDKEFASRRTNAQLEDVKREVVSLIKTIERDTTFGPTEGTLCDWCEYPEYCPAKKHEIKVQGLSPNKYLKEKGVLLVNEYASLRARIKELKEQEARLEAELGLIREAAVEYARREGITNITGRDYVLKIVEKTSWAFPLSGEEGREELERFIRKAGLWEEASILNLSRLAKLLDNEDLDQGLREELLGFAEEEDKTNVKLIGKAESEE